MAEKQQRLVLSIIDFLNQCISDGTVKADDREGLEIAGKLTQNCTKELNIYSLGQSSVSARPLVSIRLTRSRWIVSV